MVNLQPPRWVLASAVVMNLILAAVVLVAAAQSCGCGDNIRPPDPLTWQDAEQEWADGWCSYAARCAPELFHVYWPGEPDRAHEDCLVEVSTANCADLFRTLPDCSEPYPDDRRDLLDQCHDEVEAVVCEGATVPPVCYEAFAP